MCGRYAASRQAGEIVQVMDVEDDRTGEPSRSILRAPQSPPPGSPDHNMAPTKQAPVVLTRPPRGSSRDGSAAGAEPEVAAPRRQLRLLTWGLVPSWAKDTTVGLRMINARAETLLDKPAFARAALRRRCLVPADGWYEWQVSPTALDAKGKPRKQPFFMHRADDDVCAFAGLYELWRDPAVGDSDDPDAWLSTFTIITTAAEPGLDRIHDRQPLVLERNAWGEWLDPGLTDETLVRHHLAGGEPGRFLAHPVSRAVSRTASNGAHLIAPASPDELVGVVDPTTGEVIDGRALAPSHPGGGGEDGPTSRVDEGAEAGSAMPPAGVAAAPDVDGDRVPDGPVNSI